MKRLLPILLALLIITTLTFALASCGEEALAYTSNGDGTCSVEYEGECKETEIVIPSVSPAGDIVTSIGDEAFHYCTSLTSITIPDSVTSIGEQAFRYCTSLTSITIPDGVTSIGKSAFSGCTGLTSITIPSNTRSIGANAFYNCDSLTRITIPDSVTSIGRSAFYNCYKLVEVINRSQLDIIAWTFGVDYAIEVHSGESKIVNNDDYLFYTYDGVNYLVGYVGDDTELTLPASYNGENYVINKYTFHECRSLTSVTIGNSVTSIGNSAFYDCDSIKSVIIPDSVTSIGSHAFYDCDSLTSITIPDSVTSIGNNAFLRCYSLTYNAYDNAYYLGDAVNPYLVLVEAKSTSITSCNINANAKFIHSYAFISCDSLTRVTIGNSVTSIGSNAFRECTVLTSITIPDSVTSINGEAFYNCTGLTSVTFENTTDWSVGGNSISASNLANTSTAAKYLTDTYAGYYWRRS